MPRSFNNKYGKPGVYSITCTVNKKVYIGSAGSVGDRKDRHFSALRRGVNPSRGLQEDYNLYGKEHFVFTVLEVFDNNISERELRIKEREWAIRYNAMDSNFGYCIMDPVTRTLPKGVGEYQNQKKIRREEDIITYLTRYHNPFFTVDTKTGNLELYMNIRIFSYIHGGDHEKIREVLKYFDTTYSGKKEAKSYMGFVFIYATQYNPDFDYMAVAKKRLLKRVKKEKIKLPPMPYSERNLGRKQLKAIHIETGQEKVFSCANEAASYFGFRSKYISRVVYGEKKSYKGYLFQQTGISER